MVYDNTNGNFTYFEHLLSKPHTLNKNYIKQIIIEITIIVILINIIKIEKRELFC